MSRPLLPLALLLLLCGLQARLWLGPGSLQAVWQLGRAIDAQAEENGHLHERNQALAAEVDDLRYGEAAIEERARLELGLVGRGERFYLVVE
jgi:cell division protein FtsB